MTETLTNYISDVLVVHAGPDSLQAEVINIDKAFGSVGITWKNKDGSYLLMLLEEVEPGKVKTETFTKTAEEYEKTKLIF